MRPWSYSRLSKWETCPRSYQYRYVLRHPVPTPTRSPAAERGEAIHKKAEDYLNGLMPIYPPELQKVAAHAMMIKSKGFRPEVEIAVNDKWEAVPYDSDQVYFRAIIDALGVEEPEKTVHVQDWKTGKVYDSHKVQLKRYSPIAAAQFPGVERVAVRAIYIDQGVVTPPKIYDVSTLNGARLELEAVITQAENDKIFPTRPGSHCAYCDYSKRKGGPCDY